MKYNFPDGSEIELHWKEVEKAWVIGNYNLKQLSKFFSHESTHKFLQWSKWFWMRILKHKNIARHFKEIKEISFFYLLTKPALRDYMENMKSNTLAV